MKRGRFRNSNPSRRSDSKSTYLLVNVASVALLVVVYMVLSSFMVKDSENSELGTFWDIKGF